MLAIPEPNAPDAVADWIELWLATTGQPLSKARLGHLIEQSAGAEPSEAFVQDVWREVGKRATLYKRPPFRVDEFAVEGVRGFRLKTPYVACLLLSLYGVQNGQTTVPKLFERLTAMAVKRYLAGEVVVFGWPVQEGTNPSIRERVLGVSNALKERFVESPAERYKDRGVDVIGWKPFAERRSSQVVLLLQCAAGRGWRSKTGSLPIGSWTHYIHWACAPLTAFAVPCIISERDWHDVSREGGGILFDRVRIVNLLVDSSLEKELMKELRIWVQNQLSELN